MALLLDFESSFELISQSEDVLVFYRFLGSLEVRTKRWRGLGRSSAFLKGNFLTEFYNLIIALGLLCPAPQLSVNPRDISGALGSVVFWWNCI